MRYNVITTDNTGRDSRYGVYSTYDQASAVATGLRAAGYVVSILTLLVG